MNALRNLVKGKSTPTPIPSSDQSPQQPQPQQPLSSSPNKSSFLKSSIELKSSEGLKSSQDLKSSGTLNASQGSQDEEPKVELKDDQVQQEDRKKVFSKLTGLVGKDIVSLLSLPVSMFEPTSVLQTMLEPLRNSELLFKISTTEEPIDRISLVAAFTVSLFSYYIRTAKPFNPVLGETYEFVPASKPYKSLCEQVSHHPPIGIAHTSSDDWNLTQESHIQTKFWGTSVDVQSIGDNHLVLNKRNDHYTWKNTNACIHNILFGRIYIEHHGTIPIKSIRGGQTANVHYKKAGWFGGMNYDITGEVHDKDGALRAIFSGKWNESFSVMKIDENGNKSAPVELWRRPHHEDHRWKWDPFVEQLTELTEEMENVLPSTDSRLRTDLRALTHGNVKQAGREKILIEERERRKRREREAQGKKWAPQYFKKIADDQFEHRWECIGTYWEDRSQRLQQYKEKQKLTVKVEDKKVDNTKDPLDDVSDPTPLELTA